MRECMVYDYRNNLPTSSETDHIANTPSLTFLRNLSTKKHRNIFCPDQRLPALRNGRLRNQRCLADARTSTLTIKSAPESASEPACAACYRIKTIRLTDLHSPVEQRGQQSCRPWLRETPASPKSTTPRRDGIRYIRSYAQNGNGGLSRLAGFHSRCASAPGLSAPSPAQASIFPSHRASTDNRMLSIMVKTLETGQFSSACGWTADHAMLNQNG